MKYPDCNRLRTIEDLADFQYPGTPLAVLGQPVAHSVSPAMHNAALNAMAQTHQIFANWAYFKFEIRPEQLPEALPLFWDKGFLGLNLTLPHKVQAVGLVKEIDSEAQAMGAVNTLKRHPLGGYTGSNSDGFGLETALINDLGVALKNTNIILLGAGGAARAAAVQCLLRGCKSLHIGNRNQERLRELLTVISPQLAQGRVNGFDLTNPPQTVFETDSPVIVNATSLGLKADDPAPIHLKHFPPHTKIYDMTYGLENALSQQANENGFAYADGLSMLVWQGVRSLEIWSNTRVPAQPMLSAACHAKGFTQRTI